MTMAKEKMGFFGIFGGKSNSFSNKALKDLTKKMKEKSKEINS